MHSKYSIILRPVTLNNIKYKMPLFTVYTIYMVLNPTRLALLETISSLVGGLNGPKA